MPFFVYQHGEWTNMNKQWTATFLLTDINKDKYTVTNVFLIVNVN